MSSKFPDIVVQSLENTNITKTRFYESLFCCKIVDGQISTKMDDIVKFPQFHPIALNIFRYLNGKDLEACRRVNHLWKNFIENQSFYWKQLTLRHFD